MLLKSLNEQILKRFFHSAFYESGYAYFKQNRVQNIEIIPNQRNGEQIYAKVIGSKNVPYNIKVNLSGTANKLSIKGSCTCPMTINCKHVVATLLDALNQSSLHEHFLKENSQNNIHSSIPISINQMFPIKNRNILSNINQSFNKNNTLHITNHLTQLENKQVDRWLEQLDTVLNQEKLSHHTSHAEYKLYYLFSASHNNRYEIKLKLVLARWLKSGRLSAPKNFSDTAYSHQNYLQPVDTELLVKLEVVKKLTRSLYYTDFLIKGPHFEKLLPELIATGRCYWEQLGESSLTLSQPESAKFIWHIDENSYQIPHLSFSILRNSFIVFVIDNLWYLDKSTCKLGLIKLDLETQVAKLLLNAPKIPPQLTQNVINSFSQNTKLASVVKPKVFAKIKTVQEKPIICLHLSQIPLAIKGDYRNNWKDILVMKPVAALSFNYSKIDVSLSDHSNIINIIEGNKITHIVRNKAIEQNGCDELKNFGLINIGDIEELSNCSQNLPFYHYFLIDHELINPLDFSAYTVPLLRAKGWQINIDPNYPYQVIDENIDDWYSSIEENSGYDWFSFELGITLKGEKINLLPVLQQVLRKFHSNNNQWDLLKNDTIFAQLPDGRFIPLPTDRIRSIFNVLIELYDSESLTDDNLLRLSKLHALRLLELEAAMGAIQLRWYGGEKIRKLATKIAQFTGIKEIEVPKEFKGKLRSYQAEGVSWLQFLREYEFGGILADDMGLGKTVQTLSHLMVEKISGRMKNPSLIIAPTSLMFNWQMEANRFVPNLKVLVLHGVDRKYHFECISAYDLVLTTYPLLQRDKDILLKQEFYFLILDEAHFVKNAKSLSAQIVQQIKAKHRLCLTGTPLENHLGELWSLFHFMMPGLLGEEKVFNRLFRTPIEKHNNQERREHLIKRISPFLLRRKKSHVVKELPEKVNMIRRVDIEGLQRDLYETIRVTMQKKVRKEIAKLGLSRSHIIILDALLKLRQICCDPRLLKIETAKKLKAPSAKLDLLMTLIPELIEEGRRILLFSQFTEMLELIESKLVKQKIAYVKLTGQTKDRAAPIQQFQDGVIPLFLISLKAGGTGLNLTAADTVIHYDPWWNPAVEDQATDRAHRIGQNKTVFVYKLITKGTVEEKILEMQQNKRALIEGLFSDNPNGKLKITEHDLQNFFEPLESIR